MFNLSTSTPTVSDLAAAQDALERSVDLGLRGTKVIGNPDAPKMLVVNMLTYGSEVVGLAPAAFLMKHPQLIASDYQVALVLARLRDEGKSANINRLKDTMDKSKPDVKRVYDLRNLFLDIAKQTRLVACLDVQENPDPESSDGWILDIQLGEELCRMLPAQTAIHGVAEAQSAYHQSVPLGTIYPCPVGELLVWAPDKGGSASAVRNTLAMLTGYKALGRDIPVMNRPSTQCVFNAIHAVMPKTGLSYTISSDMLKPFKFVPSGTIIATASDDSEVTAEIDGYLALTHGQTVVGPESGDPLFYQFRRSLSAHRTVQVPTWINELQ